MSLRLSLRTIARSAQSRSIASEDPPPKDDLDAALAKAPTKEEQTMRNEKDAQTEEAALQSQAGKRAVEGVVAMVEDPKAKAEVKRSLLDALRRDEANWAEKGVESLRGEGRPGIEELLKSLATESFKPRRKSQEASPRSERSGESEERMMERGRQGPSRQRESSKRPPPGLPQRSKDPALPDLFNSDRPGLDIFPVGSGKGAESGLPLWDKLEKLRCERLLDHGPKDGFDELRRWTLEGKLWPYPIDNEWRCEEADVGFEEHVLLLERLDSMKFPKEGPIRDFMEVVAVGLSKNPYMGADKKRRHLEWYEGFFAEKEAFINKLHGSQGATPAAASVSP